jgi:4a-hydroxytetrahydrobiopterin dehydratase
MPKLLADSEVAAALAAVPGWTLNGKCIEREFTLADFAAALAFVNKVGAAAEAADHHPDILMHGWNKVRLTLSTHSAGGLTGNDFQLAGQINGL